MGGVPRSGHPCTIEGHGYRAEIAATGATLRELSHHGRALVAGFPADALRPAMRGAVLVPWPNRTADGRYIFLGEEHQLLVDEPETGTAVHGLVAWESFRVVSAEGATAVLEGELGARPGYPWQLRVKVTFRLEPDGLHQEVVVANESEFPAPVGIGAHPYLLGGSYAEGAVNGWTLEVPADKVVLSSPDRLLPRRLLPVTERPDLDFRQGRVVGDTALNHCFTGWRRAGGDTASVTVRDKDGRGTRIAWDRRCEWVQIYSADEPVDGVRRGALAVEPMTCPPNALNSGTDLHTVQPGGQVSAGWVIGALQLRPSSFRLGFT